MFSSFAVALALALCSYPSSILALDLNVFIYDPGQESTDRTAEILAHCGCASSDVVSSFEDAWTRIQQQLMDIDLNISSSSSSSLSLDMNFYFLSSYMSYADIDSEYNIDDLFFTVHDKTADSNVSADATASVHFQCGKSLPLFAAIAWDESDRDCQLTLEQRHRFLYLEAIHEMQYPFSSTIAIHDLMIEFAYNAELNQSADAVDDGGVLFQAIYGQWTHFIELSLQNIVIQGADMNGVAIATETLISAVTIIDCQVFETEYALLSLFQPGNVYVDNLFMLNVTDYFDSVVSIGSAESVSLANIYAEGCYAAQSCFYLRNIDYGVNITGLTCTGCGGDTGALYAESVYGESHWQQVQIRTAYGGASMHSVSTLFLSDSVFDDIVASASGTVTIETSAYGDPTYLFNVTMSNCDAPMQMWVDGYVSMSHSAFVNVTGSGSGGAMVIDCPYDAYAVDISYTRFESNRAQRYGGAQLIQYCDVNLEHNTYVGNQADMGGSVAYLHWQTQVPLRIANTTFANNIAYSSGGAVYVFSGEYEFEQVRCVGNTAKITGGCLHDSNGYLECDEAHPVRSAIRNSTFVGNFARQAAAAYLTSCFLHISDCTVANNTAYILGGGFVIDSTAMVEGTTFDGEDQLTMTDMVFRDNAGWFAGAVGVMGGNLVIRDSVFERNVADVKAGGILIQRIDEWHVRTAMHNVRFDGNEARNGNGGAIAMETIQLSSLLTPDAATIDGGGGGGAEDGTATTATYSAYLSMSECDVTRNSGVNGGGLHVANGNVETHDCVLRNNVAENGGALFLDDGLFVDYSSIFELNRASLGGAVYVNHENVNFQQSIMTQNTANVSGGAVYFGDYVHSYDALLTTDDACLLTDTLSADLVIANNTALLSGGGYFFAVGDELQTLHADSDCEVTSTLCTWCSECEESANTAPFGATSATQPYKMNVAWSVAPRVVINRGHNIDVTVEIRDFECQLVSKFVDADVTLSAFVGTRDAATYALKLDGSALETFVDGKASLSFKVSADNDTVPFIRNDEIFDINVTVVSSFRERSNRGSGSSNNDVLFSETIAIQFENKLYRLPTGVIVIGALFGSLSLIAVVVTAYLTKHYGTEKIITGSNVVFLFIILVGLGLCSISVILIPLAPFSIDCRVALWFVHLAFIMTVCPLAGKTWRIWLFFYFYQPHQLRTTTSTMSVAKSSTKLDREQSTTVASSASGAAGAGAAPLKSGVQKEFKWTTWRLGMVFVALPLAISFVYLLVWSLAANWELEYLYPVNDDDIAVVESCPFHGGFYTASYVLCTLSILVLVFLAIGTRKVPKNFNESFWLGACIYTICILITFMIPISLVNTINTATRRLFGIIALFVVIQTMLLFLFWMKFFKIKGWLKSDKFAFMNNTAVPSRTASTRPKSRYGSKNNKPDLSKSKN